MDSRQYLKDIAINGSPEQKRELFQFDSTTPAEKVLKKFKYFARSSYPRYFTHSSAPYHDDFILDYLASYRGEANIVNAAHRDGAKTALLKLFTAYVILNDKDYLRKYIKVNSKELANSKQFVTDVYNLMVEAIPIYGDQFDNEDKKTKREETQSSFTTKHGVKVRSATVGQDQRGSLQDAYRPDWQIFEDIEDATSISSAVKTEANMKRIQEAIDGRAKGTKYAVNANYISEDAIVQWFMDKKNVRTRITPIAKDVEYGRDAEGVACLIKATPLWDAFDFSDLQERYQDSMDWYGEFMCDPSRSLNKYFDIDLVNYQLQHVAKEPERKAGLVSYWESYKPDMWYGMGSDHSEGIGEDANALVVFNFKTGETVATHADNMISPDIATHEYARVGEEFGNCIWGPENNNKCGGIVITTIKDIKYPRVYRKEIKDNVGNKITDKLGWETNRKTRTTMLMDFRRDFNNGLIKILDERILKEMKAFSNSDLVEETVGLATRHFDLLMATAIAWQMKDSVNTSSSVKDFYKETAIGGKRKLAKS